jgi:hypothetical protein
VPPPALPLPPAVSTWSPSITDCAIEVEQKLAVNYIDSRADIETMPASDAKREFLRHTLATLAYRGGKALRGAPPGFAEFRPAEGVRDPIEILAHICDLLDWALSIAEGKQRWNETKAAVWDGEVERFFMAMKAFDDLLASTAPLHAPVEKLFQGPIADALTHVGQLCLLRRMAGAPVRGENYFVADMEAGQVGPVQSAPKKEFR